MSYAEGWRCIGVAKTFSERVFEVVRKIPRGKIASYGLIAELAGSPRAARQVGFALRLGHGLPWWRVVAKDGRIVISNPEYRFAQYAKLQADGVLIHDGAVDYEKHAWKPPTPRKPSARKPATRKRPVAK